jgi:transmembrane sensor
VSDRDAEAATWFARMRAPDAERDRTEFEHWRSDPDNAEAYENAEEDWLLTAGVAPEHLAVHRARSSPAASSHARWALAAALLLAVSLAAGWIWTGNRGAEPVVAHNATGEILLEDGTRVMLMDSARVEPKFSTNERRIQLTGGRARFTVAHDASRPFLVEAAGTETIALGTVFEVDLTGKQPMIHLVQGSVEIRAAARPDKRLRLLPGQRAVVQNDTPTLIEAPAKDGVLSMESPFAEATSANLLVADGLPLGAVIERANRVNVMKIGVTDPTISGRLVSGRFDVADAASLARKLAAALDLDVKAQGNDFVLSPKINN